MSGPTRRGLIMGAAATLAPRPVWAEAKLAYELKPVQVADGLWMIEGAREYFSRANGGAIVNIAMIATKDGPIVIDTGSTPGHGEAIRSAARRIFQADPALVIITHHHPDHWFGDQAFSDRPIKALGPAKVKAEKNGDAYADALYRLLGDWMRGTEPRPPDSTLEGGPFAIGGRKLRALPLAGHTSADLAILDEATGTIIAGDLAFFNRAPTTPDADLGLWRKSLDALKALGAAAILPGHGPLDRTGESLTQTRAYLDWLEQTLRAAAEAGEDMAEAAARPVPAPWREMGAQPQEYVRSVAHLFPGFEREALPPAQKARR